MTGTLTGSHVCKKINLWNSDKEQSSDFDFNISEGRKMTFWAFLKIVLVLQVMRVEAGANCQYNYPSYSYSTTYCIYGCCGTIYSTYSDVCCSYSYSSYSSYSSAISGVSVGVIVGSVIGGLAGLAILIGLIACCCVSANNSSRRTGTIIQPANTNMQTVVVNSTALSQGQQSTIPAQQGAIGYGYPSFGPPPPYGPTNNVSQGFSDSANPPPPAAIY